MPCCRVAAPASASGHDVTPFSTRALAQLPSATRRHRGDYDGTRALCVGPLHLPRLVMYSLKPSHNKAAICCCVTPVLIFALQTRFRRRLERNLRDIAREILCLELVPGKFHEFSHTAPFHEFSHTASYRGGFPLQPTPLFTRAACVRSLSVWAPLWVIFSALHVACVLVSPLSQSPTIASKDEVLEDGASISIPGTCRKYDHSF